MNRIHIGISKSLELPQSGFLLIDDEVRDIPRARVFDPTIHSFNPLKDLDYRRACDFLDTLDALFSRGDSTLTKDTGLDYIGDALDRNPRSLVELIPEPDGKSSPGHVWAHGKIKRLLRSPVLRRMLTKPANFSFNPRSTIIARVNRAEFGEFDSLAIGLILMSYYKGQLCVPDFGFYAREYHCSVLREQRLIASVNFLAELPPKLQRMCLLQKTVPSGATFEDAKALADAACLRRGHVEYSDFVTAAMTVKTVTPLSVPPVAVERTRLYAAQEAERKAKQKRRGW